MLRKAPLLFVLLALVLAVAAAWSAHRWIQARATQAAATQVVTSPILVAASDLSAGQRLEGKHMSVQRWPAGTLPPGHLTQPSQADGRVLKGPLVKGEVLLANKLMPEGMAGGLSAVVPEGFRAMTVHVDEVIGVGGFLQPADRVDVLVTVNRGPFQNDPATRLVLQDVPVLAVGEKVQDDDGNKVKKHKVTVVALQLKPEQGESLALAANEGKVILALRNQGDHADHSTPGTRLTSLVPSAMAAAAPPGPPKKEVPIVEVIKGVQRSSQSLGKPPLQEAKAKQSQAAPAPAQTPAPEPANP